MRSVSIVARAACVAVASVVAAGCAGDGLSAGEAPHQYADTVYRTDPPAVRPPAPSTPAAEPAAALPSPDAPSDIPVGRPIKAHGPVSVAVVQLGEVSPPEIALGAFQRRPDLFGRVDPIAGYGSATTLPSADDLTIYRRAAAAMGDDFVLVYGGTLERRRSRSPLVVLDATIVGMFVVPSRSLTLTGRAAGSMVDVRTGRVAFTVGADDQESTLQPFASMAGAEGPLTDAVRDRLQRKLVERTAERVAAMIRSGGL
jgi:hypothetical protein